MQVILKKDIEGLGFKNEEISVKPGYSRNYLIPKGYAELATLSAKKHLQEILRQRARKEAVLLQQADQVAKKLQNIQLRLVVKTGPTGKLFGSVNQNMLSNALMEKGIEVDKKFIFISGNYIKTIGKHQVKIRLHRQLEVRFSFEVIAIEEDKKKD